MSYSAQKLVHTENLNRYTGFRFDLHFLPSIEPDVRSSPTSHSAYDATLTELYGVKIDGFLYPNSI